MHIFSCLPEGLSTFTCREVGFLEKKEIRDSEPEMKIIRYRFCCHMSGDAWRFTRNLTGKKLYSLPIYVHFIKKNHSDVLLNTMID